MCIRDSQKSMDEFLLFQDDLNNTLTSPARNYVVEREYYKKEDFDKYKMEYRRVVAKSAPNNSIDSEERGKRSVLFSDINILLQQFADTRTMDFDKVDGILCNLPFFSKFDYSVRRNMYAKARLLKFQAGDIVFKQGDISDLMYVIVRGAVSIRLKLSLIHI
eukprot:TRINITY_DN3280_c0_g1_i1.p1 TRINITY_DN3280_c0_g1~~TRINITY_DN3280_c0_g1_i1.p1  ORF type:complete len:181 (-),score=31.21 TRINITY_DN3280_c0_g1_i1:25-510(-)